MLRFTIQLKSRIVLQIIDNMYKIFIFWYGCSCRSNTGTSCPTVAARADTPYLLKNLCASNKFLHLMWIVCLVWSVKKPLGWRNAPAHPAGLTVTVSPTRTSGQHWQDTWRHKAACWASLCANSNHWRSKGKSKEDKKSNGKKKEKFLRRAKHSIFSKKIKKKKKWWGGFPKNSEIGNLEIRNLLCARSLSGKTAAFSKLSFNLCRWRQKFFCKLQLRLGNVTMKYFNSQYSWGNFSNWIIHWNCQRLTKLSNGANLHQKSLGGKKS